MESAFLIVFSLLLIITQFPSLVKPKPFSINLIHGSTSVLPKNNKILLQPKGYTDDVIADLFPNDETTVFINFTIGQPPVSQLAVFDTGSSRIWVLCVPCQDCPQTASPMFDPSRSTTYKQLSCEDYLFPVHCEDMFQPKPCRFEGSLYLSSLTSAGVLATEDFILPTIDEGTNVISDVVFGCANRAASRFKD